MAVCTNFTAARRALCTLWHKTAPARAYSQKGREIYAAAPGFLTNMIKSNIDIIKPTDALLSAEYFFAVPNSENKNVPAVKNKYITANSYAIHYWESSWFQNDFFHRLNRYIKRKFK